MKVGGPHHIQGRRTWGLGIKLKKLVVLTLNIYQVSKNIFPLYLCLAQKLICISIFYINHVDIGMYNSLKCWFKHSLLSVSITNSSCPNKR